MKIRKEVFYFVIEVIQATLLVMGALALLWMYAPYGLLAKIILTTIVVLISHDFFKHFIYVRWALIKEYIEEMEAK